MSKRSRKHKDFSHLNKNIQRIEKRRNPYTKMMHSIHLLDTFKFDILPTLSILHSNDPNRYKDRARNRFNTHLRRFGAFESLNNSQKRTRERLYNEIEATPKVYDSEFHKMVCRRRKFRRETLFALNRIGKGASGPKRRLWTVTSGIKC